MTARDTSPAKQLLDQLTCHYNAPGRPTAWSLYPEVASPDGSRRADLVAVPLSLRDQERAGIVGHELKVSRSDVAVELADPTKVDSWLRFCSHWWLVVADPQLVDGLDVPDQWGVMAPPSGRRTRTMTVLKPAPKLPAFHDIGAVAQRLSAWNEFHQAAELQELRRSNSTLECSVSRLRKELEVARQAAPAASADQYQLERAVKLVGALRDRHVYLSDGDLADGIPRFLADTADAQGNLNRMRTSAAMMRRTVKELSELVEQLAGDVDRAQAGATSVAGAQELL